MGVEQVVVNDHPVCARLRDGTVRCWGDNEYEQLGVGHDGDDRCRPTSHACRLCPTAVPGLCGVRDLATGGYHTCAVTADRRVWCWGNAAPMREARPTLTPW